MLVGQNVGDVTSRMGSWWGIFEFGQWVAEPMYDKGHWTKPLRGSSLILSTDSQFEGFRLAATADPVSLA